MDAAKKYGTPTLDEEEFRHSRVAEEGMKNWKKAGRIFDIVAPVAILVLLAMRACGEEMPEPLRAVGTGWIAEASRLDEKGNAVPLELANAKVEYVLYIDPARPLLYTVVHYRVRPTHKAGMFAATQPRYRDARRVLVQFTPVQGAEHTNLRSRVAEPVVGLSAGAAT